MTSIHDLAPSYVRDALEDDEVAAFQDHLPSCGRCQEDVALLGGRKVDKVRGKAFSLKSGSPFLFTLMVVAGAIVVIGLAMYLG